VGSALPRGYRPDIDGLRAVAVLMVVLNHLNLGVRGGFVGVDVFFVISGYLISSMILGEMASGAFTLIGFYERRVRRILPALLLMLMISSAVLVRRLLPWETEAFAKMLLAALFCVSNLFYEQKGGYFDPPEQFRALLHTWSLAAEEQFYIVFPLLLVGIRRWFPSRLRTAIVGLALVSLAIAEVVVLRDSRAAFFESPLRAWEFLTGTLIALGFANALHNRWQREAASAAGLLLIVLPGLFYNNGTVFPGLMAIPPCAGAALVIAAGEKGDSVSGRCLSWRPLVFIGLISYSLYLWHWPIVAFEERSFRMVPLRNAPWTLRLTMLMVSLAAAVLSWWFVERPFRSGRFRPRRRTLFAITGSAVAAMLAFGCVAITSGGFPSRFPSNVLKIAAYHDNFASGDECFDDPRGKLRFNRKACLNPDDGRRHFLLLGDSHAEDLYPGLRTVFPELNLSRASGAACKPTVAQGEFPKSNCVALMNYIYGDYLPHHRIDKLILSARWEFSDLQELGRAVEWIRGHGMQEVIIGPSFEFDTPLPRLLALSILDGKPNSYLNHGPGGRRPVDREMSELAKNRWKVPYVSVYEDLCGPSGMDCPAFAGAELPILADKDHFSPQGSVLLVRTMRDRQQLP